MTVIILANNINTGFNVVDMNGILRLQHEQQRWQIISTIYLKLKIKPDTVRVKSIAKWRDHSWNKRSLHKKLLNWDYRIMISTWAVRRLALRHRALVIITFIYAMSRHVTSAPGKGANAVQV